MHNSHTLRPNFAIIFEVSANSKWFQFWKFLWTLDPVKEPHCGGFHEYYATYLMCRVWGKLTTRVTGQANIAYIMCTSKGLDLWWPTISIVHVEKKMASGIGQGRLPTTDARRIEQRDAKMWWRIKQRTWFEADKEQVPMQTCLFGIRMFVRATHARHLRDYGRHHVRRLQ